MSRRRPRAASWCRYTELRGTYRKATCELTWGLILAVARHIPHEAQQHAPRRLADDASASRSTGARSACSASAARDARGADRESVRDEGDRVEPESHCRCGRAVRRHARGQRRAFRGSDVLSVHWCSASARAASSVRRARADEAERHPRQHLARRAHREAALIDALRAQAHRGRRPRRLHEEPLPDDHPLRALPNVVLTPHQGTTSRSSTGSLTPTPSKTSPRS